MVTKTFGQIFGQPRTLRPSDRKTTRKKFKQDINNPYPLIETIDIKVTQQNIATKREFVYITRAIPSILFATNNVLFSEFGSETALDPGINFTYNQIKLFDSPITNNFDFSKIAYDTRIDTDATAATKLNQLVSRFSFWKFTKDSLGLRIDDNNVFEINITQDMSGLNESMFITLEGWTWGRM